MAVIPGSRCANISRLVESLLGEVGEAPREIHSVVERRKSTCMIVRARSGSSYVVKLSRRRSFVSHSPGEGVSLLKEKNLLELLADRSGIPVPIPHLHRVLEADARWSDVLLMSRLTGSPGRSLLRRGGEDLYGSLVEQAGGLLRRMHGIGSRSWGMITDRGTARHPDLEYMEAIAARASEKLEILSRYGLLKSSGLERVVLEAPAASSPVPRRYSLIHGDFALTTNNYLVQYHRGQLSISGIFDFEWARFGHPWEDLAKVCVNLPRPQWESLFRGYGPPVDRLDPSLFLRTEALRKAAWLAQRHPPAAHAWLAGDVARWIFDLEVPRV